MSKDAIGPASESGADDAFSLLSLLEKKLLVSKIRSEERSKRRVEAGQGTRIPRLTRRSSIRYIAQVSRAVQLGHLEPKQASTMLYAAQLLIAACRLDPEETATSPTKQKRNCAADRRQQLPKSVTLDGSSD